MITMNKRTKFDEDGAVSGAAIAILSGMAVVAIIATLWIGNTTSGLAADTAACVASVGGKTAPDPSCGTNSATGAGGGNAIAADNSRPLPPNWIDNFGSGTGQYDLAKLNQAERNLERGLLRFNGLKLTAYTDSQAALTKLQNATTKANALAALQELRVILTAAREDGETTTSESTIQHAAALLAELNHPAAATALEAHQQALLGLTPLRNAQLKAIEATDNYAAMTLAQLKAVAAPIRTDLAVGKDTFPIANGKMQEAIALIDSNR
jgi:hypothetical protein